MSNKNQSQIYKSSRLACDIIYIFIGILLFFICFYRFPFSKPENSYDLTQGWIDEHNEPVSLNCFSKDFHSETTNKNIYYTLPYVEPNSILIFACRNMYADVYIDDVLHSKDTPVVGNIYGSSPGTRWHIVHLDASDTPVTICVNGYGVYFDSTGAITKIYYGNPSTVFFHIFADNLLVFIISAFLIFAGICLLLLHFYFRYRNNFGNDFLYLGTSTIFSGLWCSYESSLWQLFFSNSEVIHLQGYICLSILPISYGLIAMYRLQGNYKKFAQTYVCVATIFLIITYILHFTGTLEFHYTIKLTHIFVIILLPLLVKLLLSYRKEGATLKDNIIIYAVGTLLIVFLSISIIQYTLDIFDYFNMYFTIAIMCFLFCLVTYHLNLMATMFQRGAKAKMLRAMALTDHMTGLFNRAAFDEHKSAYVDASTDTITVGVLLFDINNLKETNDTFGHEKGDQLINLIANGIKEAFSDKGNCYRMGGDEFLVILTGENPNTDYEMGLNHFTSYMQAINARSTLPFQLQAAHGFVYGENLTLTTAMNEADAKMYENKKILKSTN